MRSERAMGTDLIEVLDRVTKPRPGSETAHDVWLKVRPSPGEIEKFQLRQGALAAEAADKSKDFYTRFPNHPKAAEARKKEYEMIAIAVRLGFTNAEPRLAALEADHARDPNLSEDERFELRARAVQRAALKKQSEGMAAATAELEKGARAAKGIPQTRRRLRNAG